MITIGRMPEASLGDESEFDALPSHLSKQLTTIGRMPEGSLGDESEFDALPSHLSAQLVIAGEGHACWADKNGVLHCAIRFQGQNGPSLAVGHLRPIVSHQIVVGCLQRGARPDQIIGAVRKAAARKLIKRTANAALAHARKPTLWERIKGLFT